MLSGVVSFFLLRGRKWGTCALNRGENGKGLLMLNKRSCSGWRIAFLLLGLCLLAGIALHPRGDHYTVRMYREVWSEAYGVLQRPSIVPMEAAEWCSGSHDGPFHATRFNGAVSRNDGGYGPNILQGAFAAADVNALYPEMQLAADWPFSIAAFRTSNDASFRFDLAIDLPNEPEGEVTATLYVFQAGLSRPEIYEWRGAVGECIRFGIEV